MFNFSCIVDSSYVESLILQREILYVENEELERSRRMHRLLQTSVILPVSYNNSTPPDDVKDDVTDSGHLAKPDAESKNSSDSEKEGQSSQVQTVFPP